MCERNIDRLPLSHPQLGTWPTTQACALAENPTSDLSVPRLAFSPLSHTSRGHPISDLTFCFRFGGPLGFMEHGVCIFFLCFVLFGADFRGSKLKHLR